MDPLSDILALLRPQSFISSAFDCGPDTAIRFGDQTGFIKCYAMTEGSCFLVVDGVSEPVAVNAGDCFILPAGRAFVQTSDLTLEPVPIDQMLPERPAGAVHKVNGGGASFIFGARFGIEASQAAQLLTSLPPVMHVRHSADQDALRWAMERMRDELLHERPGSALMLDHLAHMLLTQALRSYLETASGDGVGWFFALGDEQIGKAIAAMHADPAHRWTLQELAQHVGMSRSVFAQKFAARAGVPAMTYLTRWRMLLAADRLTHESEPVSVIASALGYESESAFSTAFKREMGFAPRQYVTRMKMDAAA